MSIHSFHRFLSSKALEVCFEKDDFSQIAEVVSKHGLTPMTAKAHLAVKLDSEKLDADDSRNWLLSVFGFLSCLAGILMYAGQIMEANSVNVQYVDIVYLIGVICSGSQIVSAYYAYQVCSEDKKQKPLRKLYIYLKHAEHFREPDFVSPTSLASPV